MRAKTPTAAFAAACLALLVAGCGAASSSAAGSSGGSGGSPGSGGGSTGTSAVGGNSGDGTLAVPAGADAETQKEYAFQNLIASCMRSKGFAYQAWIPKPPVVNAPVTDEGDYDAAKVVLSKYGFGAYAQFVYPNDPNVPGHLQMPNDPNTAARNALDAAQQKLWDSTLQGNPAAAKTINDKVDPKSCTGQAQAKVFSGQPGPAAASSIGKADSERSSEHRQNLNGDPALVALAQSYASCLRGKGITVSSTQVTDIRNAVRFQYFAEAARRAQAAGGQLDVAAATPLLTAEIQASLADLDCGRAFRAAYLPKLKQWPDAEGAG